MSGERLERRDLAGGVLHGYVGRRMTDAFLARRGSARRQRGRRVVSGLFFFPRGGSAQVARALGRALAQTGWEVTLAAGSLGRRGSRRMRRPSSPLSIWSASTIRPIGGREGACRSSPRTRTGRARPIASSPAVDDDAYERLVDVWVDALDRAGAARAEVLHLHHLTPANEAALRAFPAVPVVGQLHGTELAMLRAIEAGAPAGWRFAERWRQRMRRWARACERLIVPPGASAEIARLLALPRGAIVELPSGVELDLSGVGRSTARSGSPTGAAGWSSSRSAGTRAAFPAASPTPTTSCGRSGRRRRSCSTSAATPPSSGCRC